MVEVEALSKVFGGRQASSQIPKPVVGWMFFLRAIIPERIEKPMFLFLNRERP